MSGNELRIKRKEAKLTQEQLAELMGVDRRTIINYEKSENLPTQVVKLFHFVIDESNEGNIAKEDRSDYCIKSPLEEKERSIQFLERTIVDKETILELQREKISRLENELNAFKSSNPLSKKNH